MRPRSARRSGSAARTPTSASPATARRTSPCATARSCAPAAAADSARGGDATETYGFGVRVIHSGVWGFASSPLVTPEEIKRVTGVATDVARASADREEARRAAGAGAGLRRVLAGADREGSVGGAARGEDRDAPRRHRDDAEEPGGAVRGGDGRLRARVEVPRDQRRLVHRAGVPLHQLRRSTRPRAPAAR